MRIPVRGLTAIIHDASQTLVNNQIKLIRKYHPDAEIIVVVGQDAEKIIKKLPQGILAVENERHSETGSVRSIDMGLRVADPLNDVLIIHGSMEFNYHAIKRLNFNRSFALIDSRGQLDAESVGVSIIEGRINGFNYGLNPRWCQIAFMSGKEKELFRKVSPLPNARRWGAFEALNWVIASGGRFRVEEPKKLIVSSANFANYNEGRSSENSSL